MGARRLRSLAVVVAAAALLAGCATTAASPTETADPPAAEHHTRVPPDPLVVAARARLAGMSLEQRVACTLMLHFGGTDAAAIGASAAAIGPGGVILMGDNAPAAAAISAAVGPDRSLPALVAVDQEGGEVSRFDDDPSPGADVVRGWSPQATQDAFATRAGLLASRGVSVNFGIVADVTADPSSFLAGRVLGTDVPAAAEHVAAAVRGEHGIVLSTLKHFPGHGAAPGDSHATIPATDESFDQWRQADALPFEAGLDAGAELVMFGHLRYRAVDDAPASLSAAWHEVLRDDLHSDALAVTDDLAMLEASGEPAYADRVANTVAALNAGNDLVLFVPTVGGYLDASGLVAGVAAAVRDGRLPQATLDRAALRVLRARLALAAR